MRIRHGCERIRVQSRTHRSSAPRKRMGRGGGLSGAAGMRYYQEIAVRNVLNVVANDEDRVLLFIIIDECHRGGANDEKTIPTILTTSQKLSTGVDARNIRSIVLMRPIKSMIEFKQIIGRGTRLFDGKEYFTILDFVGAYKHFSDPEWDGEPIEPEPCAKCGEDPCVCEWKPPKVCPVCGKKPCVCNQPPPPVCPICGKAPCECPKKVKIKLSDGKEREIQHMVSTSFWSADGKPLSLQEFLEEMIGKMPAFFKDEEELRKIWSRPDTRKAFLEKIAELGFDRDQLETLQKMMAAEDSDLFDVLSYVSFTKRPITREKRVSEAKSSIFEGLDDKQKDFLEFVLSKYIDDGVDELSEEKLPKLLNLKYQAIADAEKELGNVDMIRSVFIGFQKFLYGRQTT